MSSRKVHLLTRQMCKSSGGSVIQSRLLYILWLIFVRVFHLTDFCIFFFSPHISSRSQKLRDRSALSFVLRFVLTDSLGLHHQHRCWAAHHLHPFVPSECHVLWVSLCTCWLFCVAQGEVKKTPEKCAATAECVVQWFQTRHRPKNCLSVFWSCSRFNLLLLNAPMHGWWWRWCKIDLLFGRGKGSCTWFRRTGPRYDPKTERSTGPLRWVKVGREHSA